MFFFFHWLTLRTFAPDIKFNPKIIKKMDETKLLEAQALRRKFAYQLFQTLHDEGDALSATFVAQMAMQGIHPVFEIAELLQTHGLTPENSKVASNLLFSKVEDERIISDLQAITMNKEYELDYVACAMLIGFLSITLALAAKSIDEEGGENG